MIGGREVAAPPDADPLTEEQRGEEGGGGDADKRREKKRKKRGMGGIILRTNEMLSPNPQITHPFLTPPPSAGPPCVQSGAAGTLAVPVGL